MFGIKTKYYQLKKRFTKRAIVLMYHRISEPDIDPWELAVSPSNFEQQLQLLKRNFKLCSIPDIVTNLQKARIRENCVALTFDDGYLDNFVNAMPLLEKYNIPATFFIPTGKLDEQKKFWWDRLADLIMRTAKLPSTFNINFGEQSFSFSIKGETFLNDAINQAHSRWVIPADPPTKRSTLFQKLWQMMQPLPPQEIDGLLNLIEAWAGKNNVPEDPQLVIMTKDQLKLLAGKNLFNIGLHTVNHMALSYHSKEIQEREILQNQKHLKQIINKTVTTIAYPYGEYNNETLLVAEKLGLQAGFTVEYNPVFANSSQLHLGRFNVKNWSAKEFEEKLKKWVKL